MLGERMRPAKCRVRFRVRLFASGLGCGWRERGPTPHRDVATEERVLVQDLPVRDHGARAEDVAARDLRSGDEGGVGRLVRGNVDEPTLCGGAERDRATG